MSLHIKSLIWSNCVIYTSGQRLWVVLSCILQTYLVICHVIPNKKLLVCHVFISCQAGKTPTKVLLWFIVPNLPISYIFTQCLLVVDMRSVNICCNNIPFSSTLSFNTAEQSLNSKPYHTNRNLMPLSKINIYTITSTWVCISTSQTKQMNPRKY